MAAVLPSTAYTTQELADLDQIEYRRGQTVAIKNDIKAQKTIINDYAIAIKKLERECSDLHKQVEIDNTMRTVMGIRKRFRVAY